MKNKLYFLLLLFGMLVFVLTYGGPQSNFWNTLISSISFKPLIMILLLIIILDNINTIKSINNNYLVLCRFKNLKEYYNKILKTIIKNNTIIIIIFIILSISFSLLSSLSNFEIISNTLIITIIYYYLKLFILINLLSIISTNICLLFNYNATIIFTIILILSTLINNHTDNKIISSIIDYPILFINYLRVLNYKPPIHDILSFILYISLLILIEIILKYQFINKRKDII